MEIVVQTEIATRCTKASSGWCQKINKKLVVIKCHDRCNNVLYSSACFEESDKRFCGYVYTEDEFLKLHNNDSTG